MIEFAPWNVQVALMDKLLKGLAKEDRLAYLTRPSSQLPK
jgi:hypothetical protein